MAYAEKTEVTFEKSIAAIMAMLRAAGAEQIGQMEERTRFTIIFTMDGRSIRFRVVFPGPDEIAALTGPRQDRARVAEQWRRQRGRALALVIKAKLESVESKVETFEQAFLANVVLADGKTVHERLEQDLALEYRSGQPMTGLLSGPGADR